ncbi:MAG: hypothetical protein ACM31E_01725 [Fibrobacterota bacterium]|nr:hypothetical protein [Chitinispirillaceae bacterium]
MKQGKRKIVVVVVALLFSCTVPMSGFSARKMYVADTFNDRTLSGYSICTGPLFNQKNDDITDTVNLQRDIKVLKDFRKDLRFKPFTEVMNQFTISSGTFVCDSLFSIIASGSVVEIQLLDKFWKSLDCDYFMIMRIRDAMNIHTFNNVNRKRIRIEADLWSVKNQESVWRYEIFGIAEGHSVGDREIINRAIHKVYESLPATIPSYESGLW